MPLRTPSLKFVFVIALLSAGAVGQVRPDMALKPSPDGHILLTRSADKPVFLLGDTVWTLAHLMHRDDVPFYFENRRNQGFNMVFLSGVTEGGGLKPNAMGDKPYRSRPAVAGAAGSSRPMPTICPAETDPSVTHDFSQPLVTDGTDPTNPEAYDYWDHLDFIVEQAARTSIYVALNPVVGTCYVRDGHVDASNAEGIGRFFGQRYGRFGNVIWVLGGDINPDAKEGDLSVYRSLAKGLAIGATGKEDYSGLTMTYHPQGRSSSSTLLHGDPWLTFNMQQTGQSDEAHYPSIAKDYELSPPKPVLDGEAWYEELPNRIRLGNRHATDFDVRKRAYWSVFAGSFGHIYGENSVMQLWSPGVEPYREIATIHWKQALFRPGAMQLRFLRNLIESRPMLGRVSAQDFLAGPAEEFNDRRQVTRGDGYLFVYSTSGNLIQIRMDRLPARLSAWWFNPRDGSAIKIGEMKNSDGGEFLPPTRGVGQDWVLVLDDVDKSYPVPGSPLPPAR